MHVQAPASAVATEEWLSALVDGELSKRECEALMQRLDALDAPDHAAWSRYHLIGDALRSQNHVYVADSAAFLTRLRGRLAEEAQPAALQPAPALQAVTAQPDLPAANASVFRWKMVAGFASLAAVTAIGWHSFASLPGAGNSGEGMQLAAAPGGNARQNGPILVAESSPPTVSQALAAGEIIRDPQLDELLARQYANTNALQAPAPFLRNANFNSGRAQ
ncbi:anti-anti-sigma factor [Corticibacter populi]|uniref:Anti-anti-sigma factor n=2 Tax=Corticibacter populi TaxID=1550736 RepID=A0A3M6QJ35_9BURK|nr:anti-anti-sigma factor [Corticibacter populi]